MKLNTPAVIALALGLLMVIAWTTEVPAATVGLDSEIDTAGAGAMTTVTAWVALGGVPLAAWMVKLNVPAAVGVPLSTPLVALRVRPVGNVPVATLQVIGVVPVAVNVWV